MKIRSAKKRKTRGDHTIELTPSSGTLLTRLKDAADSTPCLVVLDGMDVGSVIRLDRPEIIVGRDLGCDYVITDDGISRQHAVFKKDKSGFLLEDLQSTNGVFINGEQVNSSRLREGDKIVLGRHTVLKFSFQDEFELEYQHRLHDSLSTDALTGILNRRALEERLDAEWSFAIRHNTDISALMIDVDHFKVINDTHGHHTGDEVLRQIASSIATTIRTEDVLGRYGGEEFVVVTRGIGHKGSINLASRIRTTIEKLNLVYKSQKIEVTVSIGVATATEDLDDYAHLLRLADERLYEAKRAGRNREVG